MRKRNRRVEFRLTEEEYQHFREKTDSTRYSLGEFLRRAVDGVEITEAPPANYYILIREVKRLGANINNMMLMLNVTHSVDLERLRTTLWEVHETTNMLWSVFAPEMQKELYDKK